MTAWEVVVGIETHAQLLTKSKAFSEASTDTTLDTPPNARASAIDLALPGTLPVLNGAAVDLAIRFGLLVGGVDVINRRSIFARKNYFYPDLPKGYQISQFESPIVRGGKITIESPTRGRLEIHLTRAHLEEDAGKSLHEGREYSGIDLNRAGTPLLEIVSEPELRSPEEASAYVRALHHLVTEYRICYGDMQEGSFRCDANVSVRRPGAPLGTRCEIKNLNSFNFIEQAITYEAERQIAILERGGKIEQETRLFDTDLIETRSMRSKEDAQDYRYFPDPDLLPLVITDVDIERVRNSIPETLNKKRARLQQYKVPSSTVDALTHSFSTKTDLFEKAELVLLTQYPSLTSAQKAEVLTSTANAVVNTSSFALSSWGRSLTKGTIDLPKEVIVIQVSANSGAISTRQAKEVHDAVLEGETTAEAVIRERGLEQLSDAGAIEKLVDEVLAKNAKQVEDYRAGKEKAFNSLVGQVMKATQGKANPGQVNEILRRKLKP